MPLPISARNQECAGRENLKRSRSDSGDKLEQFYFAVGVAMAHWERVETSLTLLFETLVTAEYGVASAVINSIPSIRTRIDIVRAAAAARLAEQPDLFEECIRCAID